MKPRLTLWVSSDRRYRGWECRSDHHYGFGISPLGAYRNWARNERFCLRMA